MPQTGIHMPVAAGSGDFSWSGIIWETIFFVLIWVSFLGRCNIVGGVRPGWEEVSGRSARAACSGGRSTRNNHTDLFSTLAGRLRISARRPGPTASSGQKHHFSSCIWRKRGGRAACNIDLRERLTLTYTMSIFSIQAHFFLATS